MLLFQDIGSLGSVNLRYAGYVVTVKVEVKEDAPVDSLSPSIETFDQPEGGANALNINRSPSLTYSFGKLRSAAACARTIVLAC